MVAKVMTIRHDILASELPPKLRGEFADDERVTVFIEPRTQDISQQEIDKIFHPNPILGPVLKTKDEIRGYFQAIMDDVDRQQK